MHTDIVPPHPLRYSLWDLDNCLSDDKWRTPKIAWHLQGNERYNAYDAEMGKDTPAHVASWLLITQLSHPIFITGRRERWRDITREWICRELPVSRERGKLLWQTAPTIIMRPEGCELRPAALKELLLMQAFRMGATPEKILAAFDDVPSIVEMYRKHGIPAVVLQVHDPKLAYKPEDL